MMSGRAFKSSLIKLFIFFKIIILKNRDGRIGTAYVSFEGRCTKFMNKKEEQPLIIEFEK
jgi:replicative DNA helicase